MLLGMEQPKRISTQFLAEDACLNVCENAILMHGGGRFAQKYHVERFTREARFSWLVPVSPCFIAERAFGVAHGLSNARSYPMAETASRLCVIHSLKSFTFG